MMGWEGRKMEGCRIPGQTNVTDAENRDGTADKE